MAKIAANGCGLIGQDWARLFAQAGFDVAMHDAPAEAAERALGSMEARIADLVGFDLVAASDAPRELQRITVAPSLEDALKGAVYIQDM